MRALRTLVWLLVTALALALLRPPADAWPTAVRKMRRKERHGGGTLAQAVDVVREAHARGGMDEVRALAWRRATAVRTHSWPDGPEATAERELWAADLSLISVGCTHRSCYVGVLGGWVRWAAQTDLWLLVGAHAFACFVFHTDAARFFRAFSPRWSRPTSLPLSIFSTQSPIELLWLGSTIVGLGAPLQRRLGRLGFMGLYLGAGASGSLIALVQRHSANGAGGALATCAFHALAYPRARHSIFGLELGAKAALAVQFGLASWPALQGRGSPVTALAINLAPLVVGSVAWKFLSQ